MNAPTLAHQDRGVLSRVSTRLRSLACAAQAALSEGLLASAAELEALDKQLALERGCARRLELELLEARFALARSRAAQLRLQSGVREARQRAMEDGLTRLPHQTALRKILDDKLNRSAHAGSPLAVLYLDLDGFKLINDTHGHDVGDNLLRIVAARLRAALRSGDTVGRLGGDEFACLLVNVPGHQALAQRVSQLGRVLKAPVTIGPTLLEVRVSIGIAVWPEDGRTGAELLRSADRAMYAAKRQHCGQAFFDHSRIGFDNSAVSPSAHVLQTHREANHELGPYSRKLETGQRTRQGALGEAH